MDNSETIVLEIPANLKALVPGIRAFVDAVKKAQAACIGSRGVDYAAIERELAEAAVAIERGGHECVLASLDIDAPRVEIRGKEHFRIGRANGSYKTMAGEVVIERTLYRPCGIRNGEAVDTIAIRTGSIADGWLPATAKAMAYLLQQGPSRDAEATARELRKLPYSRSSFERLPHAVGELLLAHHAEIEDDLIQEMPIPKEAASVSAAIDRVSVPMEEPRPKPVGRPSKGAPKRPVQRNFRMAYCATVTLHDDNGEALQTIRYGRMPSGDQHGLAIGMANDIHHLLQRRPNLQVALLADGSPEMWGLLEGNINSQTVGRRPWRLIDFWHVVEKLSPVAKVIYGDRAAEVVAEWKGRLRSRRDGAKSILAELEASGFEHVFADSSQPVHEAITYLRNNLPRMRYAAARRRRLPIGSGNVEATCKSLVGIRMKRAGSRWKESTGEHILRLRAWAQSDRWDEAMEKLLATQRTSVRRAA